MLHFLERLSLALAIIICAGFAAAVSAAAPAPEPVTERINQALTQWTQGQYTPGSITVTPIQGLYEVQVGTNLVYVDETARYILIEGDMIDMEANRNLTRDRLDEVLAINFSSLPLDLAMKQVVGKGSRKIALFEDPNCPYCRKLRSDLAELDDITIYTFVYPILSEDSEARSRKAWCAPDRVAAWVDLMMTGAVPANAGECDTPIEEIRQLGARLGITATPTVFFASGQRLQGYAPAAAFRQQLAEQSSVLIRR